MIITTQQVKDYLNVPASFKMERFVPFIPDAEKKYIKPYIGTELFDLVNTWQENKDEEESPELLALYNQIIPALCRFTLLLASPQLDLILTDTGFGVVNNSGVAPASKERVARFEASTEQLGWDNIENLLRFLEENIDDYPEWVESEAYTMQTANLINLATTFNKFVNINQSRLTFHGLRQHLTNVEETEVKQLISPALFAELIDKMRSGDEFTAFEAELLNMLQGFVANRVAFLHLKMETDKIASYYYNKAREIINKTPDEFPTYRDSDYYDAAVKPFSDYENTKESSIFSAIP